MGHSPFRTFHREGVRHVHGAVLPWRLALASRMWGHIAETLLRARMDAWVLPGKMRNKYVRYRGGGGGGNICHFR